MGRESKKKLSFDKEQEQKKMAALMAARGGGKRSDLVEYDQLVDALGSQVGEGKPFKTFGDAYDAIADQGVKLPSKNMLRGRALRRIDFLSESGQLSKTRRGEILTTLGISDEDLVSGYERFGSGAAQEINKIDYATNKLGNIKRNVYDLLGIPKVAQKYMNAILPMDRLIGGGASEKDMKISEDMDKIFTDEEKFWKGYNSNVNLTSAGGLNLPLNLAGGSGGLMPDLLAGFGAGMVGKKVATQFMSEVGASVAMEGAKYQMEDDADKSIMSVVTDLLMNAVTMRGGSALANTLDKTKAGREVSGAMTTGDTQAAIEAMNLVTGNKSKIPSLLVSNPAKAVKKIKGFKSAQEVLDIKKAFGEAEAKVATDVDSALDAISPDVAVKKANAPIDSVDAQDPTAKLLVDEFEKQKKSFAERAQPFTDAYQDAGKDIDIDLNEILLSASRITDPNALSRFESVITGNINRINDVNKIKLMEANNIGDLAQFKELYQSDAKGFKEFLKSKGVNNVKELSNVKGIGKVKLKEYVAQQKDLTKRGELFDNIAQLEKKAKIGDRSSFTANDVDLIVKQLGEEIASNKNAMSSLSDTGLKQLNDIRGGIKTKLEDLPDEFSVPYKKAKEIYRDGFKVYGNDTILGDVSGAVKDYKSSGSLSGVRNLLQENPVFDGLSKYASVLPKDSDAYKAIFREGFDNKLQGVRDAKGGSVFDFQMFSDGLKGSNWEELMRFAPKGADDSVKTLSGYQSLIARMENKGSNLLTNSTARNEALDNSAKVGLFNPLAMARTIKDTAIQTLPQIRPWYNETDIGLGSNISGQLNQLLPSGSRKYIMESAEDEASYFTEQLNKLRKAKGMGELAQEPVIPSIFNKLTDPNYNFEGVE